MNDSTRKENTMKRLLTVACLCALLAGCGKAAQKDDPVLVKVNNYEITKAEFEEAFRESGAEGIGFVTAFPHITKVFRFAPSAERVADLKEFIEEIKQLINAIEKVKL
jgi:hypothetical protein